MPILIFHVRVCLSSGLGYTYGGVDAPETVRAVEVVCVDNLFF